ncbi:Oxoglutarate/iron-dependent dioxygenase [Corchorus olitorius]|uniref:Oxoglutarate/iron-dependent dioxygenase n=1 Tax=Corchorus olitorius TaxID=93759 RepID=A0A1R3KRM5_9ROSI|nr:Oxoglutarate/iron-dependent dioxygenase [Corchorus olitorius]
MASMVNVQEVAKGATIPIPQQFDRSDEQLLSLSSTSPLPATTPTIDMARLVCGDLDELQKLHSTCKDWGIFQLVNHGVRSALLEKVKDGVEEFFKLPLEEKMKFKMREGEQEGYGCRKRGEGKYDWVDSFNIVTNPLHRRKPHLFPELPSTLRDPLECYLGELQKLGTQLLNLMARALGIEKKEMMELCDDGMQAVRLAYYPPCPNPELVMGLTPHSDITLITFLHQVNGVDGLEIKRDGLWFPLSFNPHVFVVNVGDILEIFSNGAYQSIEHKVSANKEKERITIAFSVNAKLEAEIGPSKTLTNNPRPPLFRRVGMEQYLQDFFSRKLNGKSYLEHMKIQHSA